MVDLRWRRRGRRQGHGGGKVIVQGWRARHGAVLDGDKQ